MIYSLSGSQTCTLLCCPLPDLCWPGLNRQNPCFWEFCDDPELPCQAASSHCLSGRLSRNLPRGSPGLNNSTAGGKNDPARFCHRSDTTAMPALQFGLFGLLRLWGELYLWIATARFLLWAWNRLENNIGKGSNFTTCHTHIYIWYYYI